MKCPNCGTEVGNANFCPSCGSAIDKGQSVKQNIGVDEPVVSTKRKPIYKKGWFWAVIVVLLLVIIGNTGNSSSESQEEVAGRPESQTVTLEKPTSQNEATTTKDETNKKESVVEPTSSSLDDQQDQVEEEPIEIVYGLGESAVFQNLEITVTGYSFSKFAGGLLNFNPAEDGMCYCVIYLDAKNIGTSAETIMEDSLLRGHTTNYDFSLVYDGENRYGDSWANYTEFFYANDSIPAKATLKGKCLNYKVPEEMQSDELPLQLELTKGSIWDSEKITWVLR